MADVLGTNTTGYSYPGDTYRRKGVKTLWDKAIWSVVSDKLMLKPLIGPEGSNLPFITKNQLKQAKGDTIRLYMEGILSGYGKNGNATLEEYEEVIQQYFVDVYINQKRHAVKDDGELSRQRDNYDLNSTFSRQLGRWWAEHVERNLFNTLYYKYPEHLLADVAVKGLNVNSGQLVPARYWYCADSANNTIAYNATASTYVSNISTAEAALTDNSANYFGPDVLEGVAATLKTLNFPRVSYKGFEGYIGIIHPYQTAQLRSNSSWFDANIHAMPGGKDNPVFSGGIFNNAVGMWGNILLLESNLVHSGDQDYYTAKIAAAGGSNKVEIDSNAPDVYRALFLGAEAASIAEGVPPHIEGKEDFDYNDKKGKAISGIWGASRSDFVSDDSALTLESHSVLVVSTYSPVTAI
jgi:N4-gp56 family major capsid protein